MRKDSKSGINAMIPGSAFKSCHECDKTFNLFRFKYRCAKCLFCYCKDHLKEIRSEASNKVLKICDICIENSKRGVQRDSHDFSESESFQEEISDLNSFMDFSKRFSEHESILNSKIKNLLLEIQGDQFSFFESKIKIFIDACSLQFCTQHHIEPAWAPLLSKIAEEVCKTVCPSVALNEDFMDINQYVKIIKITKHEITAKFFKAAIIRKKVAYKHIPNNFDKCKVLLIKGNTWFYIDHKKILSITDIINQEKQYIRNLFTVISAASPNLVILEGSMPQKLIKKLERAGIGVLINISNKNLHYISRICQAKILNSLVQTDQVLESLGKCETYSQFLQESKTYALFHDEKNSIYTGAVILTHPSPDAMLKATGILKTLNLLYRNALLERNLLWQCKVSSNENIFEALNQPSLTVKFLSVCENRICQIPMDLSIKYYSEIDMPLGKHLISAYLSYKHLCDICSKHEIGSHSFYYIKGSGRVKFSLTQEEEKLCYDIVLSSECKKCINSSETLGSLFLSAWEYSFHKFIGNFFNSSEIYHSDYKCTHDEFKESRYSFISQGIRASLEWIEHHKFTLLPTKTSFSEENFRNIVLKRFQLMVDTVQIAVEKLQSSWMSTREKNLAREISSDMQKKIEKIDKSLSDLSSEISALEFSPLENLYTLEAYRKYYFTKLCMTKLQIEPVKHEKVNASSVFEFNSLCFSMIDEPIQDDDEFLFSKEYTNLCSGHINIFTELQQKSLAVYENDASSMIAYSLASCEYYEEVIGYLKDSASIEEHLESDLLDGEENNFRFKESVYDYDEYILHKHKQDIQKVFGNYFSFSVVVYFAKYFHCLISAICGDFQYFLQCISRSQRYSGNKKIRISCDGRYVLKQVTESKFKQFMGIAPNYFRHENKVIFHNMPSRLLRILGGYKIIVKCRERSRIEWYFLQENLENGLPEHVETYELRCCNKKSLDNMMELRFAKDFQGIPITLSSEQKRILDAGIWNDSLFLSKQNVINYFLLIKVNFEENTISAGISYYYDQFTFEKIIENKYKLAVGSEITNPILYKENFRRHIMQSMFMALEN